MTKMSGRIMSFSTAIQCYLILIKCDMKQKLEEDSILF